MKTNTLLYGTVALLLAVNATFFALDSPVRHSVFADKINQLSYSLGLQIGRNLGTQNIEINIAIFLRGLVDGRYTRPPILADNQAGRSAEIVMTIMRIRPAEDKPKLQSCDSFMMNNPSSIFHNTYEY